MVLHIGPHHPGTHGVIKIIGAARRRDGGGHRHATSATTTAGRRRSPSARPITAIMPYTDRIDYLSGVSNNLPYVMAVEALLGVEVPERARVIRRA